MVYLFVRYTNSVHRNEILVKLRGSDLVQGTAIVCTRVEVQGTFAVINHS